MIDPTTFRDVMAQWPSGVTVVTTLGPDGTRHGMTASSFSSVSLDPPLVSICLTRTLYSHELVAGSGVFGINVLAKDQAAVGRRFAGMEPGVEDRFAGETWTVAETGVPLLDSALGWFDCRVVHAYPGGDHTIFVGEVVAGRASGRSAPLLFHSRNWGQVADVLPDAATLADGGIVAGLAARGAADRAAVVAAGVGEAGIRVRVADLTAAGGGDVAVLPRTGPLPLSSALVGDRCQADRALDAGLGTVEVALDPGDPGSVDRVLRAVDGIEPRCAVLLADPFADHRLDPVLDTVTALARAGVGEIGLPDHAGRATPLQVRSLLQEVVALARPGQVRVGLHDRDRLGLVKAITALKSGVRHFDATLAGLDTAVATEDLIRLLDELEVGVPVDADAVELLARQVRNVPRHVPATGVSAERPVPPAAASPDAAEILGAAG
ncbi:flavin reductase [Nocardioides sp. YIM 152588]|uniref:flavin reductase n=1 Tax=Nocardioides sp. YIM 152588 TaxID=3158259 RepID=UPI0032E4B4DC